MASQVLKTARLVLRPFRADEGPRVEELAGVWEVASMTLSMPYPYPKGQGAKWIATHADCRKNGTAYHFAVAADDELVGYVGIHQEDGAPWGLPGTPFEISTWYGVPYWGRGYASEATEAILAFAFDTLKLPLIVAGYFDDNAASARTLTKAGFTPVARFRSPCRARNAEADSTLLTMTRAAWIKKQSLVNQV